MQYASVPPLQLHLTIKSVFCACVLAGAARWPVHHSRSCTDSPAAPHPAAAKPGVAPSPQAFVTLCLLLSHLAWCLQQLPGIFSSARLQNQAVCSIASDCAFVLCLSSVLAGAA
jgi:hypothetical protein